LNSNRKTAIIVGVLFVFATAFALISSGLTGPITGSQDFLVKASANENQMIIGVLFQLAATISVVLIPAMLFTVLRRYDERIALGYFGIRILESFTLFAGAIGTLLLVTLSQEYVKAVASAVPYFQTSGALLQGLLNWVFPLNPIIFGVGAIMFYYLLFNTQLLPRWLSIWGIIGAILVITAGVLGMFSSFLTVLALPIAVQEMAMAAWMIIKGFNTSTIPSEFTTKSDKLKMD
jgi:hypothetical protein